LLELARRATPPAATLLYSNASPRIPFRAAFDALPRVWPELRLVYTVTRPSAGWSGTSGRIDAAFIAHHVRDLAQARFFVCGPAAFTEAVVGALERLGVPASRINQEEFPGYEAAAERVSGASLAGVA
jgi:ferredoxin-NADP reductase